MKNTFLIAAALFAFSLMLSCNDNDIDDVAPNNTAWTAWASPPILYRTQSGFTLTL